MVVMVVVSHPIWKWGYEEGWKEERGRPRALGRLVASEDAPLWDSSKIKGSTENGLYRFW